MGSRMIFSFSIFEKTPNNGEHIWPRGRNVEGQYLFTSSGHRFVVDIWENTKPERLHIKRESRST